MHSDGDRAVTLLHTVARRPRAKRPSAGSQVPWSGPRVCQTPSEAEASPGHVDRTAQIEAGVFLLEIELDLEKELEIRSDRHGYAAQEEGEETVGHGLSVFVTAGVGDERSGVEGVFEGLIILVFPGIEEPEVADARSEVRPNGSAVAQGVESRRQTNIDDR